MNYQKEIQSIIKKYDLDSDIQRKQAYIACVKYADEHYSGTFDVNPFLKEAADTLKQEHIVKDAIYSMTQLDGTEKVNLEYSKSNGPTMTANKSGLKYLSDLCLNLSQAKMTGEHVHLWSDKHPMTGKTFPLTIFFEDDEWFSKNEESDRGDEKQEQQLDIREIDPGSIFGLVFTKSAPPTLQLKPFKLYKTNRVEKYVDQKVWSKKLRDTRDRMYVFSFTDDAGRAVRFALDLDDNDLFFLLKKDLD